jgi:hypothetical protein
MLWVQCLVLWFLLLVSFHLYPYYFVYLLSGTFRSLVYSSDLSINDICDFVTQREVRETDVDVILN